MSKFAGLMFLVALAAMLSAGAVVGQGIVTKGNATVFHGSTSNTSHPATIDLKKVEKKTPEYETIQDDGVRKNSARYEILVAKMHKRIKQACAEVAENRGCDCVVADGDIKEHNGLSVSDLTDAVIDRLEQ